MPQQAVQARPPAIEDKVAKNKSQYDVGVFEIFWRNFLAGASRALGAIFIYIVFTIVSWLIFQRYFLPKLTPFYEQFTKMTDAMGSLKDGPPSIQIPENFQLPPGFSLPE